MKTWEKIYWGIVLGLLVLFLISIIINKGNFFKAEIAGKITYISKGKFALYFVISWLGWWGLIWLIAKVLTGGFSSSAK